MSAEEPGRPAGKPASVTQTPEALDTGAQQGRTPTDGESAAGILTINGGSSTIKFAMYGLGEPPERRLHGVIKRISVAGTRLEAADANGDTIAERPLDAHTHQQAAQALIEWLRQHVDGAIAGVGHRIVHGGFHLHEHQPITDAVLDDLRGAQALDLAHLPREITLIETFRRGFPDVPHIGCLDTVFHRDLPAVAKLLPIPRRYQKHGLRRLGFHGLSYSYLMGELERVAGAQAAGGRVILAHLGSGASMVAVRDGRPLDTTMGLTPTGGLVMSTRPGDLDPGLLLYLVGSEHMNLKDADDFINQQCGLLGVSESTSDMSDLLARRAVDPRAAEAVALFCYQACKWVGAYTAVLGGVDTLVFSGGIGEHAAVVRAEICRNLGYLGVQLDAERNAAGAPVVSAAGAPVTVRVMHTDEELMIARVVRRYLKKAASGTAAH